MKNILMAAHLHVLRELAWSNALLAFDYDGTLAPIVADSGAAHMRARTRGLLERLSAAYRVIVISGRASSDALEDVRGLGCCEVVGIHALPPDEHALGQVSEVLRWQPAIERGLEGLKGVSIEDKRFSLAVHYRRSREKKKARAAILRMAAMLEDVRVIAGKQVINLLPKTAPHKGIALERERERLGCDTALYVGDDETDEDVFSLDQPGRLLCIRVGSKKTSAAPYFIQNQRAIDTLLWTLLEHRHAYRRHGQGAR